MNPISTLEDYNTTLTNHPLVLTYITGTNCGVCSSIKPKIQEILDKHQDIYPVIINAHEDRELAAQLSVFTIPAVLFSVQGKESIREARYFSIDELNLRLERLLGLYQG